MAGASNIRGATAWPAARVGIVLYVVSDALAFAALFAAWATLATGEVAATLERHAAWQPMTALLLGVSGSLVLAGRATRGGRAGVAGALIAGALIAALGFLALVAVEYRALTIAGVRLGGTHVDSLFYALTGFHALHVVAGALVLGAALWVGNEKRAAALPVLAIFWHVVDAMWLVIAYTLYV